MLCAIFVRRLHQLAGFRGLCMGAASHSSEASEREQAGAGLRDHCR
jgi:hypothetical protein